jgi:MOSC domain-containing protein YiiM
MSRGTVAFIHISPERGAAIRPLEAVRAVPGRGLEGDRYFGANGPAAPGTTSDREVTLIETEALEALARDYGVEMEPGETRRNVATRGVALNHLVGRRFRAGAATLEGIRLCEPCGYMERLSGKPVRPGLVHRGGLRARIVAGGVIRVGDAIEPLESDGGAPVSGSARAPRGRPRA